MPRFAITEKAGRIVAGHSNTGIGTVFFLSDAQADAALAAGHLAALAPDVGINPAKKRLKKQPQKKRLSGE